MFSPTNGFDDRGQKPAQGAISLLARPWTFGNDSRGPEKVGPLWGSSTFVNFLNLSAA